MELKLIVQNVFKDLKRENKLILSATKEGFLNKKIFSVVKMFCHLEAEIFNVTKKLEVQLMEMGGCQD